MKHLFFASLVLLGLHSMSMAQYSLTVEAAPAVTEGLTTYRFYVNMAEPTDRMSAVFGNDQASLLLETPDGAFNSAFNASWNASGINPIFLTTVPELADDTYATIGLEGPASVSGIADAADPSIVEDANQPITPYFLTDGATSLESTTLTGASWYILNTAANGLPDDDMRVFVMQVTTGGAISGQINYQVFPLGVGADEEQISVSFSGEGEFGTSEAVSGCTNEGACNYDALATEDDGSCDCSCAGGDADEDGVCDDFEVVGCDNMLACNYEPLATEDDGSCDFCSCAGEEVPFPLVVEANPAVAVEGATVYRFYVQMTEPADRMSAVFGNVSDTLMVSTPSGAFNSSLNASWNASGINPLLVGSFPELLDDSYATVGLDGPASASSATAPANASIIGDGISEFFQTDGSLGFEVNDEIGASWYVLSDAGNGLPNEELRVLIMQVTTTGSISGKVNYQVFDGGLGANAVNVSVSFTGEGAFGTGGNACGCTDEGASNYDASAQFDDGSCEGDISGCTVSAACNYDPEATIDDGSCDFVSCLPLGCTNPSACNYDPSATIADGSCEFLSCLGCTDVNACDYDESATIAGACDYDSCAGCTDESAANYDPTVTLDNGSCQFPGCIVPGACNFDSNANVDDGSCEYESCFDFGCINELACNYDPSATIADSSCLFIGTDCDDGDDQTVDDVIGSDCLCAGTPAAVGCTDVQACNYDEAATVDDGSCLFADALDVCGGNCVSDADADGICDDVDGCVGDVDTCGVCGGPGDIFECGCADIPDGDCDCDGNQVDAIGVCGGDCTLDEDADGICDDVDDCVGTVDALGECNGTCAADADADGICDDVDECVGEVDECGVCDGPGKIYDCGCSDIPDGDCDCNGNQVDVIGVCGGDCTLDEDCNGVCDNAEVPGCNISQACNFNALATQDDGSCEFISCLDFGCMDSNACNYDSEAQYDNGHCLNLDECGVCGGPGAIRACGCADIPEGDCDCEGNQVDAIGVCGGACEEDVNGNGVCDADEIMGCTVPEACNYEEGATMNDGSCDFLGCLIFGCTDPTACNYAPEATYDNGICLADGECEDEDIAGCTYENAENYEPSSTVDDGSCIFPSCEHPCGLVYDGDFNAEVGASDLLNLLTEFGRTCD